MGAVVAAAVVDGLHDKLWCSCRCCCSFKTGNEIGIPLGRILFPMSIDLSKWEEREERCHFIGFHFNLYKSSTPSCPWIWKHANYTVFVYATMYSFLSPTSNTLIHTPSPPTQPACGTVVRTELWCGGGLNNVIFSSCARYRVCLSRWLSNAICKAWHTSWL